VRSGKTSSIINKQNPNDKAPQIIGNIAPGGTTQQTRREKRVCAKKRGVSLVESSNLRTGYDGGTMMVDSTPSMSQ
jgi:hypothetical protein